MAQLDRIDLGTLLAPWSLSPESICAIPAGRGSSMCWVFTAAESKYVAKLTFDQPRFVEPGLRVALALDEAGIPTGRPILTSNDELTTKVPAPHGSTWTMAVLRHVVGSPLDKASRAAPRISGDLLGRVHRAVIAMDAPPRVPSRLLHWFEEEFAGTTRSDAILGAVEQIRSCSEGTPLTYCVVYGDPSPEILVDARTGTASLIDWGTPSWGPLLHDVAVWCRFFAGRSERRHGEFLRAYRSTGPLREEELAVLGLFDALLDAWLE